MSGRVKGAAGGLAGGLVATAWIAPIAAAVVTIAVFLGWRPPVLVQLDPVELGMLAAVGFWAVIGIVISPVSSSPAHASPDSWCQASIRIRALDAQLAHLDETVPRFAAAHEEAAAEIAALNCRAFRRHGLRWQTRSGYIALWRSIHHAEEALVEAADRPHLGQVVDAYWLRVEGAMNVHVPSSLSAELADVAQFLATPRAAWSPPPAARARAWFAPPSSPAPTAASPPPVARLDEARSRLRAVVAAVNELRDDMWAGLVQLRLMTLAALFLSEVSAYGLLALVVSLAGGGPAARFTPPIVTGIVYFVVAAVVGSLARLAVPSSRGTAVDDYGLDRARLLLVPIVSGLAGLGGSVLTIMLAATTFTPLITASASHMTGPLPSLGEALNLGANPAGLVFAILFGYAPNLLLARLDSLVATYKTAIKSTEQAGTQQSPV
jgi:hypothetical protein